MVAVGTLISATWILVGQQLDADAGGLMRSNEVGQFVPATGGRSSSTRRFPYRLVHMVLAAYLTTAFVVGAAGACHLLRDIATTPARA